MTRTYRTHDLPVRDRRFKSFRSHLAGQPALKAGCLTQMTPPDETTRRQHKPMSMIIAIVAGIANRLPGRSSPTGANAVRTAVNEIESLRETEFTATLGEPDIVENGGRYFADTKVFVPIKDAPYEGANRLVFDIPEGRNDTNSLFRMLLSRKDLTLDTMEDLDGETVPVEFIGGNCSVLWDELMYSEKGGEEDPWTDKEVEEMAPPTSDEDESPISTEETTISADDEEEGGEDA